MKRLERTVGRVTFDFPPGFRRGDVATRPTAAGSPLGAFLRQHDVTVVDPAGGPVTFARLFRSRAEFLMFLGEARVADESEGTRYSDPWPHTRLVFDSDPHLFYKATPCNPGSVTEGSCAAEVEVLCAHAGIRVVRCDNDASLGRFLGERAGS